MKSRRLIASPMAQGKISYQVKLAQRKGTPDKGVKRRNTLREQMFSALPLTADIAQRRRHVRFVPRKRLMHCSNEQRHSITSSALSTINGGTERPSAFAVLRLTTIRYFIGN